MTPRKRVTVTPTTVPNTAASRSTFTSSSRSTIGWIGQGSADGFGATSLSTRLRTSGKPPASCPVTHLARSYRTSRPFTSPSLMNRRIARGSIFLGPRFGRIRSTVPRTRTVIASPPGCPTARRNLRPNSWCSPPNSPTCRSGIVGLNFSTLVIIPTPATPRRPCPVRLVGLRPSSPTSPSTYRRTVASKTIRPRVVHLLFRITARPLSPRLQTSLWTRAWVK